MFLFSGWCDDELPSGWDGDIPAEGHIDPRRFRISGLHHPVWRNRNAGGIHFSWGRVNSKLSDSVKKYMYNYKCYFCILESRYSCINALRNAFKWWYIIWVYYLNLLNNVLGPWFLPTFGDVHEDGASTPVWTRSFVLQVLLLSCQGRWFWIRFLIC